MHCELNHDEIVAALPMLRRAALRFGLRRPDAADLVQATVERALARAHQFQNGSNMNAWLKSILRSVFIDMRRRVRGEVIDTDFVLALPVVEVAPDPEWMGIEPRDVEGALTALSKNLQLAYRLFAIERLPYGAIAVRLGVEQSTVGTRVYRARRALRAALMRELQKHRMPAGNGLLGPGARA